MSSSRSIPLINSPANTPCFGTQPNDDPANPNGPSRSAAAAAAAAQAGASARSLRELWLKKLECEAVLSLLRRLDILRRAPAGFDALIRPSDGGPCKIGAAVVVLSEALEIMFSDDVAQVQAFDRIMDQLMSRKQRGEEVLWATLADVLYRHRDQRTEEEERRRRERMERRARALEAAAARGEASAAAHGAGDASMGAITEDSDEDETNSYTQTCTSFEDDLSTEAGTRSGESAGAGSAASPPPAPAPARCQRTVGRAVLESEIDLEGDELRCLAEPAAWANVDGGGHLPASYLYPEQALPRYTDPVLALRILVECLTRFKRLDDVEQYLSEGMERDVRGGFASFLCSVFPHCSGRESR